MSASQRKAMCRGGSAVAVPLPTPSGWEVDEAAELLAAIGWREVLEMEGTESRCW